MSSINPRTPKNKGARTAMEKAIHDEIEDRAARQKLLQEQVPDILDMLVQTAPDGVAAMAAGTSATKGASTDIVVPAPSAPSAKKPLAVFDYAASVAYRPALQSTIPEDMQKLVQEQTQEQPLSVQTHYHNAREYFEVQKQLNELVQTLPTRVQSPAGWLAEYSAVRFSNDRVDVMDLLNAAPASDRPKMLQELVQWALSVQRQYEGANARAALTALQGRARATDEHLRDTAGTLLLNKFSTLVALLQTPAFKGKPQLLVQCLLDDWKWLEQGVAYKTALSALSGPLLDASRMTTQALTSATVSDFVELHRQQLIDEYRCYTGMREPDFDTISIGYQQKHCFCKVERTQFSADAPVILTLGYQEQLPEGSRFDSSGLHESYRDNIALVITATADAVEVQVPELAYDAALREAVADAVTAMRLLDAARAGAIGE